jgi:acyl-CoA synthetase (AMP-forming)/AMP-acid ligase II
VKLRFDHAVEVATGGAAPPSAIIEAMEAMGFRVTHLYGLTESYGPATLCAWQDEWSALDLTARAQKMARQGVPMPTLAHVQVGDPQTGAPVPRDGATLGEVMLRGNTIMKGYLRNEAATRAAFAHDWVQLRRSCRVAPGQLHRDQGPQQGHHHHRRRERELARGRGVPVPPSARHGSRGRGAARTRSGARRRARS